MVTNNSIYWFVFMTSIDFIKNRAREIQPINFWTQKSRHKYNRGAHNNNYNNGDNNNSSNTSNNNRSTVKRYVLSWQQCFFREINCEFCLSRILPYFPMLVSVLVTGVTSQVFSIIWLFRPCKPYTLANLITGTTLTNWTTLANLKILKGLLWK